MEEKLLSAERAKTQAVVFAALLFTGLGLFAVVSAFNVDWFTPTVVYIVAIYFGWVRFFAVEYAEVPQDRSTKEADGIASRDYELGA